MTDNDIDEEGEQSLRARAKAYLLGAYAYVAGAIAQSVEEIAPQLRGLSLPGVSSRAAKSLLLAGVLITAAVAMPADPFSGGETTVETQDPVQGETYEATEQAPSFDGATMNQLPSTFTDAAADAPEPPDKVRASAGSQTMNVQTSVVDGEPAIVLEDDRTHDGRWVSIDTMWFEEHLGEVPNAAFITHESGNEYAAPLQVRGDSAAFYVREFSTNTVTFDGEVRLSGSQAGDGSQFQYDLANTTGINDPSLNLTGVENTAPASSSISATDSDTLGIDIGGTTSPRDETVTLTGVEETSSGSLSPGTVSDSYSTTVDVGGNQPARNAELTLTGIEETSSGSLSPGTVSDGYSTTVDVGGNQPARDASVTFTGDKTVNSVSDSGSVADGGVSLSVGGNAQPENAQFSYDNYPGSTSTTKTVGTETSTVDYEYRDVYNQQTDIAYNHIDSLTFTYTNYKSSDKGPTVYGSGDVKVWVDGNLEYDGGINLGSSKTVDLGIDTSTSSPNIRIAVQTFSYDEPHYLVVDDLTVDSGSPSLTVSDDSGSTTLSEGDSTSLDISQSTTSIGTSTTAGQSVDYSLSYDEVTQTQDPSVSIGGASASVSGMMSDGETVTKSLSLSPGSSQSVAVSTSGDVGVDASWTEVTATEDPSVTIGSSTVSHTGVLGAGETVTESVSLSTGSQSVDASVSGPVDLAGSWTEVTATEDPSVTVGGSTVSHTGVLGPGETVTESVSLSTGSQSADVSVNGPVDVAASWTEVTETRDPVVEVNGETTGIAGTLSDGETASLDTSSAWLQEGTNTVTISTDSPASGPASLVGFEYSHGAETTVDATVDETTWSQSTNVTKTWAGERANATATIPMNDRVVSIRDVKMRTNGTTWQTVAESEYTLNGTDLTMQLGDISEGTTTEIRATGSKVRVSDGAITVLEPSTSSATLNTRIQINDAGPDFALSVDETTFANRVHYAENATWGAANGSTTISASGEQTFTLPDATTGAEATVRTWPVEVAPTTGTVTVPELEGDRTEPGIAVRGDGNSEVDYTFVDAKDATPYILYSTTNSIVRDEGLASSPITLTDDNSDETLVFQVDDGSASGSGSGSGPTGSIGGGAGPMDAASGGFTALQALVPDGSTLLLVATLLGGLFVVGRRSGVITPERQQAATSAAGSALGTVNSLVERALDNEIVVGALILGGGAFVLGTDFLPEQTRLIVGLAAAPVAMYLALQQFGRFDFRIWAGSTAVIALLGLNVLAPGFFQTIAEEAGIIIVIGAIYLGYRAISAYREDASTPDEVTRLEIDAEERDD
ncbi:hypothetical protein [Halorubrum sp. CBA1229]|uniref:beta strand repeat-containing protein n=1 Tax=Halorubrum sp. CBA1229 TaxID=1853699 RepID=UPI000F3F8058|nr:hypothetical protein [Halorubrum sp. CBA1229]QKY17750.1 hypothetical protein Hrr1229_012965 [Halorubrum sp. CBA1229]